MSRISLITLCILSCKIRIRDTHNSEIGSVLRSGENHHPELDLLMSGEDPEDPPLEPSTSAKWITLMDDTSGPSSSASLTGRRYTRSNPLPEMMTNSPEEERGEIEDELLSPPEQGMRGETSPEEEEPLDQAPPTKASPNCPSDAVEDLHLNSTNLHLKRKGRKAVAAAHKAVSDGPT